MPNYANIQSSTQTGTSGGYKPKLYFAPTADITTWGRPVPTATLGSKVQIDTAHTFAAGKSAVVWDAKIHSVKISSKTVGEEGAYELETTAEVTIIGDNPATTEQVQQMMNDQTVVWIKDADCLDNDSYVQLGDDCVPVAVTPEFDGKTTKEGKKEWKITFTSKKKLFYLATLDITP